MRPSLIFPLCRSFLNCLIITMKIYSEIKGKDQITDKALIKKSIDNDKCRAHPKLHFNRKVSSSSGSSLPSSSAGPSSAVSVLVLLRKQKTDKMKIIF